MAKYEVETTTGSVYHIDTETNTWSKNGGPIDTIYWLADGEWDGTMENVPDFQEWSEVELPSVGKSMFIRGRGMHNWYLTTPVVEIREVEEWE